MSVNIEIPGSEFYVKRQAISRNLPPVHHLSNPKPRHTTGRSGRGVARRGGEGERGWVERDAVGSIRLGNNPPSCAPATRRHCPGRLFGSTNKRNPMYLSSPKPGHTTGGSGRGVRRCGGAGSGGTGCQQNSSPGGQSFLVPPKASQTRRLNVSPGARTSEILCKPMEEQNPRLTTGPSTIHHRFITGLSAGREVLFLPGC